MTDLNMRAADGHDGAGRPNDFGCCDQCGREFGKFHDGLFVSQHPIFFMLCSDCGEEMEDD